MSDEPSESTEERVILRFYIAMQWDARTYAAYIFAPSDWDQMSDEGKREFLDREALDWMHQQIEYGAEVCDAEWKKRRDMLDAWEQGGSIHEPEEVFD